MRNVILLALGVSFAGALSGCREKGKRFDTNVEVLSARVMGGQGGKAPSLVELELRFVDCPGQVHRVMRGDKEFAACGSGIKKGDKLPATIDFAYDSERENYRDDVVKLGACDVKLDPKEDANYESVQVCTEVKTTGVAVGVRCDKRREGELIAKCPWLRRL